MYYFMEPLELAAWAVLTVGLMLTSAVWGFVKGVRVTRKETDAWLGTARAGANLVKTALPKNPWEVAGLALSNEKVMDRILKWIGMG